MQQQTPEKGNKLPEVEIQEERPESTRQESQLATVSNFILNIADSVSGRAESRILSSPSTMITPLDAGTPVDESGDRLHALFQLDSK